MAKIITRDVLYYTIYSIDFAERTLSLPLPGPGKDEECDPIVAKEIKTESIDECPSQIKNTTNGKIKNHQDITDFFRLHKRKKIRIR